MSNLLLKRVFFDPIHTKVANIFYENILLPDFICAQELFFRAELRCGVGFCIFVV